MKGLKAAAAAILLAVAVTGCTSGSAEVNTMPFDTSNLEQSNASAVELVESAGQYAESTGYTAESESSFDVATGLFAVSSDINSSETHAYRDGSAVSRVNQTGELVIGLGGNNESTPVKRTRIVREDEVLTKTEKTNSSSNWTSQDRTGNYPRPQYLVELFNGSNLSNQGVSAVNGEPANLVSADLTSQQVTRLYEEIQTRYSVSSSDNSSRQTSFEAMNFTDSQALMWITEEGKPKKFGFYVATSTNSTAVAMKHRSVYSNWDQGNAPYLSK